MGKRHNKNKNKKLSKNSDSEKKSSASLQDGAKRKQIGQNHVPESSSKCLLPENSSYRKSQNDNSETNKSNKQTYQRLDVIKSAGHASKIAESKAVCSYKGISGKQASAILGVPELRPKQGNKIISDVSVNESEFGLCEDLFSSGSDNNYMEFYNPYDNDFFYSKDILDFSNIKEKHKNQEDCRNKNPSKVVTSGKNWNDTYKSGNKKTEIKNKPNKQVPQNSNATKLTARSNLTDSFECENVNGNPDYCASNVSGARRKYNWNVISQPVIRYENCSFSEYNYSYDSDDDYERKNSEQNLNLKQITVKENFISSVNEYNHSKDTFSGIYHKWLPERKSTLEKLKSLHKEVQDSQMKYNEAQANFKEISAKSRHAKISSENMLVGFFSSAMTMAFDAASGLSAFAQAFDTDTFQSKFQEIMDHDAEITKNLYESRSQCVAEYQGVEEVMKKFHCETLSSTMSKISNTLEVEKYWEAMKKAYRNDDMTSLMDIVGNFFNNACESEVLGKVCDSLGTYVTDNPPALEGCKSTGKTLYEYANVLSPISSRRGLRGRLDTAVSEYLMYEDMEEVDRLKRNYNESKLESQIENAMYFLGSEMEEIVDTYYNLFKSGIQHSLE